MKVIFITAQAPWGRSESFVLTEALGLSRHCELILYPARPGRRIAHEEGHALSEHSVRMSLLAPSALLSAARFAVFRPHEFFAVIGSLVRHSRSYKIALKNLAALPKAAWLSLRAKAWGAKHVHACWASTPATMAYYVSRLTRLPWSFSAHRWDIDEDNMLAEKVRSASFVRVISNRGREKILKRVPGEYAYKIKVIHMGVSAISETPVSARECCPRPILASIGNLVSVKGHSYLLQACQLLVRRNTPFCCWIIGDGPLMPHLRAQARNLGIEDHVRFWGFLSHQKVLELFETGQIQICVHASTRTTNGEEEGIPVSLMEALSYGLPVIATDCGGTRELVEHHYNGLLVPPGNPEALADAIQSLVDSPRNQEEFGKNGLRKLRREFNLETISEQLHAAIERAS